MLGSGTGLMAVKVELPALLIFKPPNVVLRSGRMKDVLEIGPIAVVRLYKANAVLKVSNTDLVQQIDSSLSPAAAGVDV